MKTLGKIIAFFAWLTVVSVGLLFIGAMLSLVTLFSRGMEDFDALPIKSEHAVAVIDLEGEIFESKKFEKQLRKRIEDDDIKALVVRINSPGGAVGTSEEIYRMIKDAGEKKPVVCSLGSIAASGGLYAALGCDKIFTNRGTLTGSIGVIFMMPDVSSIMNKFGVDVTVVKQGKFKDAGVPFRSPSESEKEVLQSVVDQAYEQFIKVIAEARSMDLAEVRKLADGRVILGESAVKLGLADEIGNVRDAARKALELAGDEAEPDLIYHDKKDGLLGMFDELSEARLTKWFSSIGRTPLLAHGFIDIQTK